MEQEVILVKNTQFIPSLKKCSVDKTIEWKVESDKEDSKTSIYFNTVRNHVIGFDTLNIESPYLSSGDTYSVQFHAPGIYKYKCLVYPAMKGTIEVIGNPSTTQSDNQFTVVEQVQKVERTDTSRNIMIKGLVEKFLKKANDTLSPLVYLGLEEESEQPKILKDLLNINIETIHKNTEAILNAKEEHSIKYAVRRDIITNCMNM